jgi:hypothetical protein
MSNVLTSPQYQFDPSGVNPANRIIGELQPLTGMGDRDYYLVVPAATPFFADSIQLSFKSLQGDIRLLVEGVDYYLSHWFMGASRATAQPVYGSITLMNSELRGTLVLNNYQTIGGDWTVDTNTIATVLADRIHNPRRIAWDQVAGYPTIFPPVPHEWNLVDMVGQSQMLAAIDRIVDAILTQASSAMIEHINDMSGQAHGITPASIGAVSYAQLIAAVNDAVADAGGTTDGIQEGDNNKFFTEARVLATKLAGYVVSNTVANLADTDSIMVALTKLQAQATANATEIAKKLNTVRPYFTGLGSQNLVKLVMTTSFSIDITQAEAFQVRIQGSGSIGFNTATLGDMTDRVIAFSVTTVNDGTANAYAIAWPSNVKWVDGTPPPRTTAANAKDYWYFVSEDGGATYSGSLSNANPR